MAAPTQTAVMTRVTVTRRTPALFQNETLTGGDLLEA